MQRFSSHGPAHPTRRAVRRLILERLARDVPLEQIRHDDRAVHRKEGYGGRPIESFPPFSFYRLFAEGRSEEAIASFRSWYREQFRRYAEVPKRLGGMQHGSLHRLVASQCAAEGLPFRADEPASASGPLERAIALRVSQRIELLVSIRDAGFLPAASTPILGIARRDGVYLTGGHHRAAALRVLGHATLPSVSVFDPSLHRALKALRIV
jgi:hypothetical protein